MVVVFVSDDDGYDLAKEVSGKFFGKFDGVDKDGFVVFGEGEPRVF